MQVIRGRNPYHGSPLQVTFENGIITALQRGAKDVDARLAPGWLCEQSQRPTRAAALSQASSPTCLLKAHPSAQSMGQGALIRRNMFGLPAWQSGGRKHPAASLG
jgi:hypothetical protein